MSRHRLIRLLEFACIVLALAASMWILLPPFDLLPAPPPPPSTDPPKPLLSPWRADMRINPDWFLVGIGRRADGEVAVQLRSPRHKQPAWVRIGPRPKGPCPSHCSRNLLMSLEFSLTRQGGAGATGLDGVPQSLEAALREVAHRIDVNDVYPDAAGILNAQWPDIGPPADPLPESLRGRLAPLPGTAHTLGWLLLLTGGLWLILYPSWRPSRLRDYPLVAALTALAAWLRWPLLSAPFLSDGPIQRLAYAHAPIADILLMRTPELHHPPLTFLLLRLSMILGGTEESFLRLPFWLAALALIPALYVLSLRVIGRPAALLVAAIAALHPALIDSAKEINDFSLLLLAGTLLMTAYARALDSPESVGWRWLLVLMGIFTLHSNLLGLAWVSALLAWDWLVRPARRAVIRPDNALLLLAGALPILGLLSRALWDKATVQNLRLPGLDWGTDPPGVLLMDSIQVLFLPPQGLILPLFALWGVYGILKGPLTRRRAGLLIWVLFALVASLTLLFGVDRVRAAYGVVLLATLLPLCAAPISRILAGNGLNWAGLVRRGGAALFATLCLAPFLLAFIAGARPAQVDDPYAQVRGLLDAEPGPQVVAMVSRMGPLGVYHLCGRVELWEEREQAGEHPCTEQRRIVALGMPYDWIGDGPGDMDRRIGELMKGRRFFLLLGSYTSPQLSEWAARRCTALVTERQLALLRCPAMGNSP